MREIRLVDLMDVSALQRIQDGFSRYTGLAALTTDEKGVPITEGSGFSEFCMNLTRKTKVGCNKCGECDKNGALLTLKNGGATVYGCHAGLMDFAAPIMVEGRFIGSFIGGQVRTGEVDEEQMTKTALELGIEPEVYIAAAKKTTCMKEEDIQRAADFLEEIAATLSEVAYHSYAALLRSKKIENAARSQSAFIMDLCTKLNLETNEIPNEIIDAIDYVKHIDGELELFETSYNVKGIVGYIVENVIDEAMDKGIIIDAEVEESVPENLMGDAGRISQLVSKVVQILLAEKSSGTIKIVFSTHNVSYATRLYATIYDCNTGLSKDTEYSMLNDTGYISESYSEQDDVSMLGIHMVNLLLEQMSGTISISRDNEDATVKICIPQLLA